MMDAKTPQDQLNFLDRYNDMVKDGWTFVALSKMFCVYYPEELRRVFGIDEYKHIRVVSSDLEAAVVAAETARTVLDMAINSGKLG
jgi:hypothetical protein